jgi:hypothetical protein
VAAQQKEKAATVKMQVQNAQAIFAFSKKGMERGGFSSCFYCTTKLSIQRV